MSEPQTSPSVAPVRVLAAHFADALTWDTFQQMSDEEFAQAALDALDEAGYLVLTQEQLTEHVMAPLNRLKGLSDRLLRPEQNGHS